MCGLMAEIILRLATANDAKRLPAIEAAAGEMFRDVGMDDVASAPPNSSHVYERAAKDDRLWVATSGTVIAGFLMFERLARSHFICELDVDPACAGQGLGARLINALTSPITLSCFEDVPWNKPYYERLGFRAVAPETLGPAHVAIAKDEARRFHPWPRCIMMRT